MIAICDAIIFSIFDNIYTCNRCPYRATNHSNMTMHAITAMPAYENQSFEELRMEDYMNGNRGQGIWNLQQTTVNKSTRSKHDFSTPKVSKTRILEIKPASFEKNIKGKSIEELEEVEKQLTESIDLVKEEKEKAIKKRSHN